MMNCCSSEIRYGLLDLVMMDVWMHVDIGVRSCFDGTFFNNYLNDDFSPDESISQEFVNSLGFKI